MYSIRTQVYLNPLTSEYDTILAIDRMPAEMTPLRDMVRMVNTVPLSPYRTGMLTTCLRGGVFALSMPSEARLFHQPFPCASVRESPFMGTADLPILFTLLSRWGYHVDTGMASIVSRTSPRSIYGRGMNGDGVICYISMGPRSCMSTGQQCNLVGETTER
jgi:hypothetical protein